LPLPCSAGGADAVDAIPMPQAFIVFRRRAEPPTAAARYRKSRRVKDFKTSTIDRTSPLFFTRCW
jgi:hypothetical protein